MTYMCDPYATTRLRHTGGGGGGGLFEEVALDLSEKLNVKAFLKGMKAEDAPSDKKWKARKDQIDELIAIISKVSHACPM